MNQPTSYQANMSPRLIMFIVLSITALGVYTADVPKNVNGRPLTVCSMDPITGVLRDGKCLGPLEVPFVSWNNPPIVCAVMTEEFLDFTKSKGNDLTNLMSLFGFPGLRPGDRWCLNVRRWREAWRSNKAPPVDPEATSLGALDPAFEPINKLDLMNSCGISSWDEQLSMFKPETCYPFDDDWVMK